MVSFPIKDTSTWPSVDFFICRALNQDALCTQSNLHLVIMPAAGGGIDRSALQKVPKAACGPYIWLAAIWASYCGGLHGFNTANISGAMGLDPFVRDFGWTNLSEEKVSDNSGWAVSSMLLVSNHRLPLPVGSPDTVSLSRAKLPVSSCQVLLENAEAASQLSSPVPSFTLLEPS